MAEYIIFLYGSPKVGKSTFCSQLGRKPLFFATEKGLNALSTYSIQIRTWEDFVEACKLIGKGKHDFTSIVIDTIDNLIQFCSVYVCKQNGISHEGDLPMGKGWWLVKNEFKRFIIGLSSLPYGLIMVSHEKTKEIKTATAIYDKHLPTVPDGYRDFILGLADMILYAHSSTRKVDGKVEQVRVLRTKASESHEAGDRTGKLPPALEFTGKAFMDAWEKINKIEDEQNDK